MKRLTPMLIGVLVLLLTACAGGSDGATAAVESYLNASIEADAETLTQVICAERESEVEATARRFSSVSGARIENMDCTFDEAASTVSCTGQIIATYGTEDTAFPLETYQVVQEDGEWKWCGEA